jgi:hypothetical protein
VTKQLIPISQIAANQMYDVVVRHCGASENDRSSFLLLNTEEFRFGGNLGHGGKLWVEPDRWRVTCYPEDETLAIKEAIFAANEELKALRKSYLEIE